MTCCFALSLMACNTNDVGVTPSAGEGRITLDIQAPAATISTRAEVADSPAEAKLEWIDVFVFSKGSDYANSTVYHYERIDHSSTTEPHTLGINLSQVPANNEFYVDVIANSVALKSLTDVKASIANRKALFDTIESTEFIHVTGLEDSNAPSSFIMDGVAYKGASETPTIILNSGDTSQDVALKVTLRRAAAKVVFNFNLNTDPATAKLKSFGIHDSQDGSYTPTGSYHLDNMKYKAYLMAEAESTNTWSGTSHLRTTSEVQYGDLLVSNRAASAPATDAISGMTLTTYVYCHKWDYEQNSSESLSEIEPSVIVNLPAVDVDGNHEYNYYEISLDVKPEIVGTTEHFALERNNYYVINATINALGGKTPQQAIELNNLKYEAYPWDEKVINVGGSTGAAYLTLNTYHFEMHNESVDSQTLTFASSSNIKSITLDEAYYYNKYGNRINLASGDNLDQALVSSAGDSTGKRIFAEADSGIAGNITINSPLEGSVTVGNGYNSRTYNNAHKNTIRYLKFTVTNNDNISRTFTVMQYPLIYITNQQGWYSYRSDFKNTNARPTTYEFRGDNIYAIRYSKMAGQSSNNYDNTIPATYTYNPDSYAFWRSKYAVPITSGNNAGMSSIYYYHWDGNRVEENGTMDSADNGRMYHVRVTATSNEYTLGVPRITGGLTDSGADNAKLVSPSFMIASRLGVITVSNLHWNNVTYERAWNNWATDSYNEVELKKEMIEVYGKHCQEYVETYKRTKSDGTTETIHLDDWRLPTEAELKIIMDLQGPSSNSDNDNYSIDYLLNAKWYLSANGPVENANVSDSGNVLPEDTSVRCVRDAFDSKTPSVVTNN